VVIAASGVRPSRRMQALALASVSPNPRRNWPPGIGLRDAAARFLGYWLRRTEERRSSWAASSRGMAGGASWKGRRYGSVPMAASPA
jgi:hypothetical protein